MSMSQNAAFAELSNKHVNNLKLLRQVRVKQQQTRRELATWRAVADRLADQGERPVYRAVGRVFLADERAAVERDCAALTKSKAEESDKWQKQEVFLIGKIRENEKQLGELMRASGQ